MYIDPVVIGVACTIGGECVLIVLALAVSAVRYIRKNGLNLPLLLRMVQGLANAKAEEKKQ